MRGLSEDPCQLSSRVFRDPHINFAYGGSADIRGRQNADDDRPSIQKGRRLS